MLTKAGEMRESLLEAVSEFSDDLMMLFLEGEEVPEALFREAIRRGTISNKFVPVLCGSSLKNKGLQLLLDGVCDYLPSPLDIGIAHGFEPVTH
jgi:elongation factor G